MTAPQSPETIHAQIAAECEQLRRNPPKPGDDLTAYRHALALLECAVAALEQSIPQSFEHAGRRYWLRLKLERFDLGLHDSPASASPMLRLQTEGKAWCGFKPGH